MGNEVFTSSYLIFQSFSFQAYEQPTNQSVTTRGSTYIHTLGYLTIPQSG